MRLPDSPDTIFNIIIFVGGHNQAALFLSPDSPLKITGALPPVFMLVSDSPDTFSGKVFFITGSFSLLNRPLPLIKCRFL